MGRVFAVVISMLWRIGASRSAAALQASLQATRSTTRKLREGCAPNGGETEFRPKVWRFSQCVPAGGFLSGVPLGCLRMWDQDHVWVPGPSGANADGMAGAAWSELDNPTRESHAGPHRHVPPWTELIRLLADMAAVRVRSNLRAPYGPRP